MQALTLAEKTLDAIRPASYARDSTDRSGDSLAPCGSRGGAWYCVHTRPQQEIIADVELRAQGFRVFLPLEARPDRIVPFFPRYLFALPTDDAPTWGAIRSTRGVSGLVMRTGGLVPAEVPQAVIDRLWAVCEPNGVIYPAAQRQAALRPGRSATITSGLMEGWRGIIQQSGRDRVSLLIAEIGRVVSVPRGSVA